MCIRDSSTDGHPKRLMDQKAAPSPLASEPGETVPSSGATGGDEPVELHVLGVEPQEAQEALEGGDFGNGDDEISDADEEILEKCLEVIYAEKKASTSLLQRRLRLGYTRAARMIDILESRGIVGAGEGAKPREILVDLSDDFD